MNAPDPASPDPGAYLDELTDALELRDTPADVVTDVVRQVESHVHDTGEDPYETFGAPAAYAREFSPRATTTGFWLLVGASVLLTLSGGWLATSGAIDLAAGPADARWDHPWAAIGVGLGLVLTWGVLLVLSVRRSGRRRPAGAAGAFGTGTDR